MAKKQYFLKFQFFEFYRICTCNIFCCQIWYVMPVAYVAKCTWNKSNSLARKAIVFEVRTHAFAMRAQNAVLKLAMKLACLLLCFCLGFALFFLQRFWCTSKEYSASCFARKYSNAIIYMLCALWILRSGCELRECQGILCQRQVWQTWPNRVLSPQCLLDHWLLRDLFYHRSYDGGSKMEIARVCQRRDDLGASKGSSAYACKTIG